MKTSEKDCPEILIVAAEASSARYALRLLQHWKNQGKKYRCFGIGNRAMEAEGFEIIARAEDIAVVGIQEVFSHWSEISAAFKGLVSEAKRRKPDLVLLLDYPDFNFRLAKKLKKQGLRIVYYISPQIWAWRKGRIKLVKKFVDKMLVLFPFEVDFYRGHGVDAEFVGHPLLDELSEDLLDPEFQRKHRQKLGISEDRMILGLMPGSRRSEIQHHLKEQLKAAKILKEKYEHLEPLLLVAPTLDENSLKEQARELGFDIRTYQAEPFEMIGISDLVLCASGTATVMVGLLQKPMVIMYRMKQLTVSIAKLFFKRPKFFGMSNLILDREVSPELFQKEAEAESLVTELSRLIEDESLRKGKSVELSELRGRLGAVGTTDRVAEALDEMLEQ